MQLSHMMSDGLPYTACPCYIYQVQAMIHCGTLLHDYRARTASDSLGLAKLIIFILVSFPLLHCLLISTQNVVILIHGVKLLMHVSLFLDFDCVDHVILSHKLTHYGVVDGSRFLISFRLAASLQILAKVANLYHIDTAIITN